MRKVLHVVVGDEHADAFVPQLIDDALDVFHGDGVDPGEGFVEQDEGGAGREGTGNFSASPLAAWRGRRPCFFEPSGG